MSSTSNISGLTNLSYLQPTSNATQPVGGADSDGDNDSSSGAGKVGRSNFMSANEQAPGQSMSGSSGTPSATSTSSSTLPSSSPQDPQATLQVFLHSLFAAQHHGDGQGKGAAATGNGTDADGDNGGSSPASRVGRGGSNLANIHNPLQQLSLNSQGTSTGSQSSIDALLNSSSQNLIDVINTSQGQGMSSSTPTLQSFLQNLLQDLGGQNIPGVVVCTKA